MIKTIRKVLPLVATYMAKNGGLNTVTAVTAVGVVPSVLVILESPTVQQGLERLGGAGETGAIIAAVIIGLRTALGVWRTFVSGNPVGPAQSKKK